MSKARHETYFARRGQLPVARQPERPRFRSTKRRIIPGTAMRSIFRQRAGDPDGTPPLGPSRRGPLSPSGPKRDARTAFPAFDSAPRQRLGLSIECRRPRRGALGKLSGAQRGEMGGTGPAIMFAQRATSSLVMHVTAAPEQPRNRRQNLVRAYRRSGRRVIAVRSP